MGVGFAVNPPEFCVSGGIKDGRSFKGWVEFQGRSQDDISPSSLQSRHEVV